MGVDIHMNIVDKDGNILKENIFDGRNSEWFDNISGKGDDEYAEFPWRCLTKEFEPALPNKEYYYGHKMVKVSDFCEWYENYKPYLKAGWVTKYDAWAYKKKNIIPYEVYRSISAIPVDERAEYVFCEYEEYDPSTYIYNLIMKEYFEVRETYIVYCFDC